MSELLEVAHVMYDPDTQQIACGVCGGGGTIFYDGDFASITNWTIRHIELCAEDLFEGVPVLAEDGI